MNCEFLKELIETPSVSGFEADAAALFCKHLEPYADEVGVDVMNNAYACSKAKNSTRRIMLDAHIDEIGMQVIYVDDFGHIYVRRAGGIDVQCLPGSHVLVRAVDGDYIPGVIGKKPVHLMLPDEKNKTMEIESLWIDTGLSPEEVKERIQVGTVVVTAPNFTFLSQHRISSKALDDKIGVYVVSEVFRNLASQERDYDLYAVASAQEEVGTKGIVPAAYSINPDIAICVDVDFATDVPDCPKRKYGDVRLGEGVIITRNLDSNLNLSLYAEKVAKEQGVPYQISARNISTGGNNTSRVQLSRNGVQTLFVSIPCRYMHTPVEMCDLRDVEAAIRLLTELLK